MAIKSIDAQDYKRTDCLDLVFLLRNGVTTVVRGARGSHA